MNLPPAAKDGNRKSLALALAFFIGTGVLLANPQTATVARPGDIFAMAGKGDLGGVKALLASNADVNAKRADGGTALMWASLPGHLDVVRALLDAKADVNAKRNDGGTALMMASQGGHLEVVRALLDAKADVNAKLNAGFTSLMLAAAGDHLDVVRALLDARADINANLNNGTSALHLATQAGHTEVVRALLAAKAEVNAKGKDGRTALVTASRNGSIEIVRALLAAKADPNAKGDDGGTPLMMASQEGSLEIVRALLAAKADANAKSAYGATALMLASIRGFPDVVRALLAAKADVNARANSGGMAIWEASMNDHPAIVQILKAAAPAAGPTRTAKGKVSSVETYTTKDYPGVMIGVTLDNDKTNFALAVKFFIELDQFRILKSSAGVQGWEKVLGGTPLLQPVEKMIVGRTVAIDYTPSIEIGKAFISDLRIDGGPVSGGRRFSGQVVVHNGTSQPIMRTTLKGFSKDLDTANTKPDEARVLWGLGGPEDIPSTITIVWETARSGQQKQDVDLSNRQQAKQDGGSITVSLTQEGKWVLEKE